ncbi:MAG: hypothetical protein ABIJ09_04495 [Pseudomonadota bacterium]
MRRATVVTLSLLLLPAALEAEAIRARETAHLRESWSWSTGVFNPMRLALSDTITVETHPLLDLVGAFNVNVQKLHMQGANWTLTLEGGLSCPTLAFRLTQVMPVASPFFPRWTKGGGEIGWVLVPSAGLIWSYGGPREGVWTVRGDVAVGLPIGPSDAYPVDSVFAPLELAFAPALTGLHARVGTGYDYPVLDWLRLRAQLFGHMTGPHPPGFPQLSPWFIEGYGGVDLGIGDHARVTLGAKWYNWDQHATEVVEDKDGRARRQSVRSNDFWPTIDFIWES